MERKVFVSFTARKNDGERIFGNAEIGFRGAIKSGKDVSMMEEFLQKDAPNIAPNSIIITNWQVFE